MCRAHARRALLASVTRAFSSQLGIMSSVSDDSYVPRMTAHEMAVWNGISPAMEGNFTFRVRECVHVCQTRQPHSVPAMRHSEQGVQGIELGIKSPRR